MIESAARHGVTSVLEECPAAANVILCVSEVATNAVTHSRSGVPGGHFTVVVDLCRDAFVKVTVIDDGGPWAEGVHGGDITYRHGLTIAQDLSAGMGVSRDTTFAQLSFLAGRNRLPCHFAAVGPEVSRTQSRRRRPPATSRRTSA
jgi:Histidine kinase-like ATPase domain